MKGISFLRFCVRHALPFGKRVRQLLRRKERSVQLEVQHTLPDGKSTPLGAPAVVWTVMTRNAWAVRIGEFLLPVLEDGTLIRITWPLAKGENRIVVEALGIASKKSQTFVLRNEEPEIRVPGFSNRRRIKNSALKPPAFSLKSPVFAMKRSAERPKSVAVPLPTRELRFRQALPVLKTAGSVALPDLTADLLQELNQTITNPTK